VIVTAVAFAPDDPIPASFTFALNDPVVAFAGTFPAHTAPVPLLKFTHAGRLPDVTINVYGGVPFVTSTGHACPIVAVKLAAIVGFAATVMLMGVSAVPLAFSVTGIITARSDAGAVYVAVVVVFPLAMFTCVLLTVPHPPAGAGAPHVGAPNVTPFPLVSFVATDISVVCPFTSTCIKEELLCTVTAPGLPLPPPQTARPTLSNSTPNTPIAVLFGRVLITFLLACILGPVPPAENPGEVPELAHAVKLAAITEQVAARDISGFFGS